MTGVRPVLFRGDGAEMLFDDLGIVGVREFHQVGDAAHMRVHRISGHAEGVAQHHVGASALTGSTSDVPNLVRIEDFTTGSALSTSRTGALVYVRFEVVHNPASVLDREYVAQAPLAFVSDLVTTREGRKPRSSVNSMKDDEVSDIALLTRDGKVTVAGDCLLPLSTSTRLEGNTPNPFNPSTVIAFALGEEAEYTLTLFDILGRKLRVLKKGRAVAGSYELSVDMSGFPSGIYLYRLETPGFSQTKSMVLAR